MILLTKTEEILLVQFHEQKGDRVGARPGDTLTLDDFREAEAETKGLEFEGALDTLVAHNLVKREGERYMLTQEGYDYLYTREGGRRIDEG
jgi:hypothetical protein